MTTALGRLAIAALCFAFAGEAAAREIRHPARGTPAFVVQVPDDWTNEVDPDRNLILASPDSSTAFSLTLGSFSGDLEDAAKGMLNVAKATPPTNKTPTSISGQAGFLFESTMKTDNGAMLRLNMAIVRVREKGFMSCTQLQHENATARKRQLADGVMRSVRIVGATPGSER